MNQWLTAVAAASASLARRDGEIDHQFGGQPFERLLQFVVGEIVRRPKDRGRMEHFVAGKRRSFDAARKFLDIDPKARSTPA